MLLCHGAVDAVAVGDVGRARRAPRVGPTRRVRAWRRRRRRRDLGLFAARAAVVLGPVPLGAAGPLVARPHRLRGAPLVRDVGRTVAVVLVVPAGRVRAGLLELLRRQALAAYAAVELRVVVPVAGGPLVPSHESVAIAVPVVEVGVAVSSEAIRPALGVLALRRHRGQRGQCESYGGGAWHGAAKPRPARSSSSARRAARPSGTKPGSRLCTSTTALLLLPVGDGGGSNEVAFAESGVSHVR